MWKKSLNKFLTKLEFFLNFPSKKFYIHFVAFSQTILFFKSKINRLCDWPFMLQHFFLFIIFRWKIDFFILFILINIQIYMQIRFIIMIFYDFYLLCRNWYFEILLQIPHKNLFIYINFFLSFMISLVI